MNYLLKFTHARVVETLRQVEKVTNEVQNSGRWKCVSA